MVNRSFDSTARWSFHIEPHGLKATGQHYLRDLVYGSLDGIVTTFAVVAGAAGGSLSEHVVLIVGAANLMADGLSMAVGNYLSIRSNESVRRSQSLPEEEASPARHAVATFLAFVGAGAVPLAPYLMPGLAPDARLTLACLATLAALFGIGSSRAAVTDDRWWISGIEMLVLGVAVSAAAYLAGLSIAGAIGAS